MGIIAEEMYTYLERENLLPEEQKGCKRGSRGTKDLLLIDKTVLRDCKKRHTNYMTFFRIVGFVSVWKCLGWQRMLAPS